MNMKKFNYSRSNSVERPTDWDFQIHASVSDLHGAQYGFRGDWTRSVDLGAYLSMETTAIAQSSEPLQVISTDQPPTQAALTELLLAEALVPVPDPIAHAASCQPLQPELTPPKNVFNLVRWLGPEPTHFGLSKNSSTI